MKDPDCVKPEFRSNVQLRLEDMRRELPPERIHLILCRHVAFTYFDQPLHCQMLDRLVSKLTPGGILVTGKQAPLPRLPAPLTEFGRRMGIYRKEGAPTAGPTAIACAT